jgi:hypothetical protein
LRCRLIGQGGVEVHEIHHHNIAEPPVAHDYSWRHDDFRSARATGDGEYIAWHAVRRTDHHVAGELDNDVLPLLGHVVVGSRRQIEHDAAIAFVIADAHRHGREAVSER